MALAALTGCTKKNSDFCSAEIACEDGFVCNTAEGQCEEDPSTAADANVGATTDAAEVLPPIPKRSTMLAYDASRSRVVLFGGYLGTNGPNTNETWEWDGIVWRDVTPTGSDSPPARSNHALAYDAARQRVVLFGGNISNTENFSDTWEWDGTRWTDVTPGGPNPAARRFHTMAYDSARSRIVLYGGGTNATGFDDTWEWDGSGWTDRTPAAPQPPTRCALAYDAARGQVVLFGRANTGVGETWLWDGTTWTDAAPSGPVPDLRTSHRLAYDESRERVVLFGGIEDGEKYGDTWEWDGTGWSERTPTLAADSPSARLLFGLSYDGINNQVLLFGGGGQGEHGDTWLWSGNSWQDVTP